MRRKAPCIAILGLYRYNVRRRGSVKALGGASREARTHLGQLYKNGGECTLSGTHGTLRQTIYLLPRCRTTFLSSWFTWFTWFEQRHTFAMNSQGYGRQHDQPGMPEWLRESVDDSETSEQGQGQPPWLAESADTRVSPRMLLISPCP